MVGQSFERGELATRPLFSDFDNAIRDLCKRFITFRIGVFGHVGRFASADSSIYGRGRRVVCRTRRGLEIGEVLTKSQADSAAAESDGKLLRAVTVEDDLLIARLEKNREAAYDACVDLLEQQKLEASLIGG